MKLSVIHTLLTLVLLPCSLFAVEIKGTITEKENDRIQIALEGSLEPNVGDPLRIEAMILGRVADGGQAEIVEVGDGFVWAKILNGNPNVKMTAIINSAAAVDKNATASDLFSTALTLFKNTLPADADPYRWQQQGDANSDAFTRAYPLFAKAAAAGSPEAQYFAAKYLLGPHEAFANSEQGIHWLQKAAEAEYANAQYVLGNMYYIGRGGLSQNQETAKNYFRKAADQGHAEAASEYAFMSIARDRAEGLKYLAIAARAGHEQAQLMIAKEYKNGTSDFDQPADLREAIRWYNLTTEQGNARAMIELGDLYYHGGTFNLNDRKRMSELKIRRQFTPQHEAYFQAKRIPVDIDSALHWYEKAADRNALESPVAMSKLGDHYSNRQLKAYDPERAFKWYNRGVTTKSLTGPDTRCLLGLAKCYRLGIGVNADAKKAFTMLAELAVNPHAGPHALTELGKYHLEGIGTAPDPVKAHALFTKANRDVYAGPWTKVYLGDLHREGLGVSVDFQIAFDFYQQASKAILGDAMAVADAHAKLARAWQNGEGVSPSPDFSLIHLENALAIDPQHLLALRCMGLYYQQKDPKHYEQKMIDYFERAAKAGDAESHFQLGQHYSKGFFKSKNKAKAKAHYRQAADQGHAAAQRAWSKLK